MRKLAPIVLFTYNRPIHTLRTLEALMKNELANESVLYVFCDGPKEYADQGQINLIHEVRKVVRNKQWCKEVFISESTTNKGLADSIVNGVTQVVSKHGKIIVLEDDVETSVGFLRFMNDALGFYEQNEKVMHISGYMYPHKMKLPETLFFNVPYPGGGWGTWQSAWQYYNHDAIFFYNYFEQNKKWNSFNKFGGKYLQKQLKANVDGVLNTWFIKWHSTLILNNGLTLYPGKSLTNNIGFDETGTNCTPMTKFDVYDLADFVKIEPIKLKENLRARLMIVNFYQGKTYFLRQLVIRIIPVGLRNRLKEIFNLP